MRDIGKNIRTIRIQKNMTQEDLAGLLFVTRQTVSNYETGRSRPDVDMLIQISAALEADVNAIFYGVSPPNDWNRERRRLWISLATTLTIGLLVFFFWGPMKELTSRYNNSLVYLMYCLVLPVLGIAVGWTVLQGLGVILHFKKPQWSVAPYVRWGILILLGICVVVLLPFWLRMLMHLLEGWDAIECFVVQESPFMMLSNCLAHVMLLATRYCSVIFGVIGAVLWLCGFPAERE